MVSSKEVRAQSLNAYNQWKDTWTKHATEIKDLPKKPLSDFMNVGVGKACLLVANGYSFEENIETIKRHKDNVDILCCDKTLGHLLDHGIKPTYVIVCDAVVNFEKYMEPWKDMLQDTILFANVTANPKWVKNGNWKDVYFFVNQDCLQSEHEFCKLSNCKNTIPAATNVSNAMVVFLTQSDNTGRRNFFGYDKLLLIGYDYSWRFGGKYYAFDEDGGGKKYYMKHSFLFTHAGSNAYTSNNLMFSARWLETYIRTFKLPIIQCTRESILMASSFGKLDEQMSYGYKQDDAKKVKELMKLRDALTMKANELQNELIKIGNDHYFSYLNSI